MRMHARLAAITTAAVLCLGQVPSGPVSVLTSYTGLDRLLGALTSQIVSKVRTDAGPSLLKYEICCLVSARGGFI